MNKADSSNMFTAKSLRRLIIPLIIEQFLAVAIGMADTFMVSAVGQEAVSAVSIVDTINVLLITIFSALATGGAIVTAQYLGRDDGANAAVSAKQLLIVTGGMSILMMVFCLIGNRALLSLVFGNTEAAVLENCIVYFFWSALSYPFIALYNAGAALFRTTGNSKITMYISTFMNLLNVGGNALLIYGFQMGVAGAAIASLVSRIAGAIAILLLLRFHNHALPLYGLFRPEFHPAMAKTILRIGIPNGLENSMFQIGKILLQGLIASFGTAAIAANAMGNTLAQVTQIPGQALGLSLITVVGQCVGAQRYDEAKHYMKLLTGITYLTMGVLNLAVFFGIHPLVGLFGLPEEASRLAAEVMRVQCIGGLFLWPLSFALPNGLRAAADVRFTMITSILSMWLCRIAMSYVLGQLLGLQLVGVWISMMLDWLVRSIAFLLRYLSGRWKTHVLLKS